ncbi:hypothetical protein [Psychroserpens damuponensis]|uniref:hypothetical protein n=1 Tax=Psychroserpens damuponensis TaxID=943936 RepID=UPI00058E4DA8|nr:hypothetical protein [Psychroserpens damuponensis]
MKTVFFKGIGLVLVIVFLLLPLAEINSHTYTLGISNFNYACECFGCFSVPFDCNGLRIFN